MWGDASGTTFGDVVFAMLLPILALVCFVGIVGYMLLTGLGGRSRIEATRAALSPSRVRPFLIVAGVAVAGLAFLASLFSGSSFSTAFLAILLTVLYGMASVLLPVGYFLAARWTAETAQRKGQAYLPWFWLALIAPVLSWIYVAVMPARGPGDPPQPRLLSWGGTSAERRCPFCAEPIQPAAILCRWCGRDLPPKQ